VLARELLLQAALTFSIKVQLYTVISAFRENTWDPADISLSSWLYSCVPLKLAIVVWTHRKERGI